MAQSREQQILAKATPRPWEWSYFSKPDGSDIQSVEDVAETVATSARKSDGTKLWGIAVPEKAADGATLVICYTGNGPTSEANSRLIQVAVNAFEADRGLIRQLTEAIGNFVCTSCDHPLRLHLDEYGCEQEGPDTPGNEGVPAHASGPCGCVGGSPAEDALIEALRAAKKARE